MIPTNNRQALLLLNNCPWLGPIRIKFFEQYFSNLTKIFSAEKIDFINAGLNINIANNLYYWLKKASIDPLYKTLDKEEIDFITWYDEEYPVLLKTIYDPPPIIFFKGEKSSFNSWVKKLNKCAVVGSRDATNYAHEAIIKLLTKNLLKNTIIISGLAVGVDSLAHKQSLLMNSKTIAVLGSGLDRNSLYPSINFPLAQQIVNQGGLIISEFSPGTLAKKQNFPRRNRLISGLSQVVCIIEAAKRSGSLITARLALEQGRDVLAVFGNITSLNSYGTNELIKQGAMPISNDQDIIDSFQLCKFRSNINNDTN